MRFKVLGILTAHDGTEWAPTPAGQPRTVLALLLLDPGRVVSLDGIAAALWPGRPPASAAGQIYGYVMRLRRLIGDRAGTVLVRHSPGYRLELGPGDVDAERFESLLRHGRSAIAGGDPAGGAEHLAAALALWRGPAFADVAACPTVAAVAARLEDQRLGAVEDRIEADLLCGRHAAVVDELVGLVARHPLRERLWQQVLLALYRCGRRAEALDAYRRVYRVLDEELGVFPGGGLQMLHRQILRADTALDAPPRRRPGGGGAGRRRVLHTGDAHPGARPGGRGPHRR